MSLSMCSRHFFKSLFVSKIFIFLKVKDDGCEEKRFKFSLYQAIFPPMTLWCIVVLVQPSNSHFFKHYTRNSSQPQGPEIVITFACSSAEERFNWIRCIQTASVPLSAFAASSGLHTAAAHTHTPSALPMQHVFASPSLPPSSSLNSTRDDDLVSNASSGGSSASGD